MRENPAECFTLKNCTCTTFSQALFGLCVFFIFYQCSCFIKYFTNVYMWLLSLKFILDYFWLGLPSLLASKLQNMLISLIKWFSIVTCLSQLEPATAGEWGQSDIFPHLASECTCVIFFIYLWLFRISASIEIDFNSN